MTRLRDLRVSRKLAAGFGVVCLLLAAAVGLGVKQLHTAQDTVSSMSDVVVPGVQSIGAVKYAFAQSRVDLVSAALASGPQATTASLDAMRTDDTALDAAWEVYLDTFPVSTQADRDSFAADLAAYRSARRNSSPSPPRTTSPASSRSATRRPRPSPCASTRRWTGSRRPRWTTRPRRATWAPPATARRWSCSSVSAWSPSPRPPPWPSWSPGPSRTRWPAPRPSCAAWPTGAWTSACATPRATRSASWPSPWTRRWTRCPRR